LKELGYSKETNSKLLTKSFTTQSVQAAQESTWDKKTGVVTSSLISEDDMHLRQLQNSWVDTSLGRSDSYRELNAAVNASDLMAFNFEDGISLQSLNTTNSGLEGQDVASTIATNDVLENDMDDDNEDQEVTYEEEEEYLVEDVNGDSSSG
jgi:hypothetical protein